jgi:hypothetical protein
VWGGIGLASERCLGWVGGEEAPLIKAIHVQTLKPWRLGFWFFKWEFTLIFQNNAIFQM